MKLRSLIAVLLLLSSCAIVQAQDIDTELASLAEKLALSVKERGNKKITVLDFADLHGGTSELGKYIAEQLTVDFVTTKRDFAVLDRANLKSILAEHKLTAKGLVDPENAKKLGLFAGVDALILGTMIPKNGMLALTAKIITTETAEVVGAARAEFKVDETVKELMNKGAVSGGADANGQDDGPNVVKTFGDLRIELSPLHVVNGSEYELMMTWSNQSSNKTIWTAISAQGGIMRTVLNDPLRNEWKPMDFSISGISLSSLAYGKFYSPWELKPQASTSVIMKFTPIKGTKPTPGQCNLQMEIFQGEELDGKDCTGTSRNLVAKIEAK